MAEKTLQQKRLGAVIFYGFIVLIAYFLYLVFRPFLIPICWAAVLAVVFEPLRHVLERKLGGRWAAVICTLIVIAALVVPTIFVGISFVHQGLQAAGALQQQMSHGGFGKLDRAWAWLVAHVPGQTPTSLSELLHRAVSSLATYLATQVAVILRNVAIFIFDLVVMILALIFFFSEGSVVMKRVRQVMPFDRASREEMLGESRDLVFASVTSSLAAAVIHGIAGGLAFGIAGITAPVFWGVAIAFFSLLPVVGDLVIWVPAMIYFATTNHWGRAIFLAVVITVIAGLIDNFMRPWFISGRVRMNGLVVFVAVIGGIAVFGLLGVVLGPIIVAAAVSILDLYGGISPVIEKAE